jgi:hypothetical protein
MRARHLAGHLVVMALAVATVGSLAGCERDDTEPDTSAVGATDAERFPDVTGVVAAFDDGSRTWTFEVTMSSPYDTPERYADGWRVMGPDGTVYGAHTLTHDHANEQPFTRRQSGVVIPDDVTEVTVEGRDLANGYGGSVVVVSLDRDGRQAD